MRSSANKVYTKSQTILVNKELNTLEDWAQDRGIREIISTQDDFAQPKKQNDDKGVNEQLGVSGEKEFKAYEVLAAPFEHHSLQSKKRFLSFEISEVEPRECQANKTSMSGRQSPAIAASSSPAVIEK